MNFTKVYEECSPQVRRSLSKLGVAEKDLADATHDVFAVVHRKLPGFEQRSQLSTWLHGICRRVAADYRRRACNRREVLDGSTFRAGVEPRDLATVVHARVEIEAALARLDATKREVVTAYSLEDTSMRAIAKVMRVPLQTAYARLYAGHRALRAMLEAEDEVLSAS